MSARRFPASRLVSLGTLAAATVIAGPSCSRTPAAPAVIVSKDAGALERFAARELRRYLYLRTGSLPELRVEADLGRVEGDAVVVAARGDGILNGTGDAGLASRVSDLPKESYLLKTVARPAGRLLVVAGADGVGALYGAYQVAEKAGVRFALEGDVVPDARARFAIPDADETGKPLFDVRGIQPFHDFPEGPDWWSLDNYKAVLGQLPKLRMNFFGLHTYPDKRPNAEPAVWIGLARDFDDAGRVSFAYPSSWQNTARGNWGYRPKATGDYHFGASLLFENDAYGDDVMDGLCRPDLSPAESAEVFNRAGALLSDSFGFARRLGVRTCVGTETALTVPEALKARLAEMELDPKNPAVVREIYRGIFGRIAKAYPIDYYWFWTPEGWTWEDASPLQMQETLTDLRQAVLAAADVGATFRLATSGWVLGPPSDRTLFDRVLPPSVALSTINREVGKAPVDPGFGRISGRSKWAIPWLEDDPSLTSPQLWAGRMRRDAADALRYGCDGLLGIHWRTRVLSPNVLSLARAAWDQSWSRIPSLAEQVGPITGQFVAVPADVTVAGTSGPDAAVARDVRDRVFAYYIPVPDGAYSVSMTFVEPTVDKARGRVFDVSVQGRKVLEGMDIFDRVGKFKALDVTFPNVTVSGGRMAIEFGDRIGYPAVAAIAIAGKGFSKKINCGGPAVGGWDADWPETLRHLPVADFYADWAGSQFGPEAGPEIAALFERMDGKHPIPVTWTDGPGGIVPNASPWDQVRAGYAFVDEMAALRPKVQGAGARERFDYWLRSFDYMRATARFTCLWNGLNAAIEKAKAAPDAAARAAVAREEALPVRVEMAATLKAIFADLLATAGNMGELGTIDNWERHLLPVAWEKPGEDLRALLGTDLPAAATLGSAYDGPTRIIVPALRTTLEPGEDLRLKVLILHVAQPDAAELRWRDLGKGAFRAAPLKRIKRGVYFASVPAPGRDIEWYVRVKGGRLPGQRELRGETVFPPTAPKICQTVTIFEK